MVGNWRCFFGGKCLTGMIVFFFIFSFAFIFEKEASAAPRYNLIVKIKGAARKHVAVKVTADTFQKTLKTNNAGVVKFRKLKKATFTVIPTKEGYSFNPSIKDITLRRTRTLSFTIKRILKNEALPLRVSKPKNGTYFVKGEEPIITVFLPYQFSRSDYSQLRLVVYGPQDTTRTKTAVKLLNASTDRSRTIHHYIDLSTNSDVEVRHNILKYKLQPITDEEKGTYTASLWAVLKEDSAVQSMQLADFQIGTGVVEEQIVEKGKCGSCHQGADNGKFYMHHIDPFSGDPGSIENGNWALDSWPVRSCKSCHNNDGFASYTDPSDSAKKADSVVKRVHGIHMGEELKDPADTDPVTGIFKDYTTVKFPYGVRGEKTGSTWNEIPGVKNCTACHVDNRWKTNPSRLACGACHDNIWFGDPASLPAGGELHPGGKQDNDLGCSACHPADTGGSKSVAEAHKVDSQSLNSIDISMTPPQNGKFYTSADDAGGVVVTVTIKDDNGNAIDHTKVDDTGSTFSAANLFVYGPRAYSKPVLSNWLYKNTKLRASVTNAADGPWAGVNGKTLKIAVDGGSAMDITITGSEPVTQTQVVNALNTPLAAVGALASKGTGSSAKRVKIESLTQGGENSRIAIYNSDVATAMTWKATGVTMEPYVKVGAASYPNNDLRKLTKVNPALDYIDPDVTRNTENITYTLRGKFGDLTPGTYFVYVFCVPERNSADNTSKVANFTKNAGLGFMTFQVGTETEDKKIATNCADCHGDSVMHLYENNIHPAQFNPDYCKACHDYGHYNTGDAFVNQGGTSTNGWSGYGAVPISRRTHGVHRGKYLEHSEEIYANADYFKDVIFPEDIRNCTKCHTSSTSGTWKTEPSRVACLACHDNDEAKSHAKLMTYDPTPLDPYSGDELESCKVCHGPAADIAIGEVHNISNPYKPPYEREPAED